MIWRRFRLFRGTQMSRKRCITCLLTMNALKRLLWGNWRIWVGFFEGISQPVLLPVSSSRSTFLCGEYFNSGCTICWCRSHVFMLSIIFAILKVFSKYYFSFYIAISLPFSFFSLFSRFFCTFLYFYSFSFKFSFSIILSFTLYFSVAS